MATGGLLEVTGAGAAFSGAACWLRPESSSSLFVDVLTAVVAELAVVAADGLRRETAMTPAPRALAAPAPSVMADTQARPLLRATCRAWLEAGELFIMLQSTVGGRWLLRLWWSIH